MSYIMHIFKLSGKARISPCSFHLASFRRKTSMAATQSARSSNQVVEHKQLPMLPIFGSFIPQYSGIPSFDIRKAYDFYPAIQKAYGDFYTMGVPNLGVGIYGKITVLSDPHEMLKVFRDEGTYPYGGIQADWPIIRFFEERKSSLVGLFRQDEEWRRLRMFLQTDLLSPQAAKGYVPGMIRAAEMASKGAIEGSLNMDNYLSRCSFDMFSTIMFGELIHTADDQSGSASEDKILCEAVLKGGEGLISMMLSPQEFVMDKLGIKSAHYKSMSTNFSTAMDIAYRKIEEFKKRKSDEELNVLEKSSYLSRAIDRQVQEGKVTETEMTDLSMLLLISAVDTTSSYLHWILVHLALNQEVQEQLADELRRSISNHNGLLCEEALNRKAAPFLHAVIRETHRLTPAVVISMAKTNSSEIEVHGKKFPPGSMFQLDTHSKEVDPKMVSCPRKFDPSRWSNEAVNARKGTSSEVIDHPLFRDPFSHGARKCPGSRVANYELMVMIAQLVLDWKFCITDDDVKSIDDIKYVQQLTVRPENYSFQFSPRTN